MLQAIGVDKKTDKVLILDGLGKTVAEGQLFALGETDGLEPGTPVEFPVKFVGKVVGAEEPEGVGLA